MKLSPTLSSTLIKKPVNKIVNKVHEQSLFEKAIAWCDHQQSNRLFWLGFSIAVHGCILTPLTVIAILLAGTNLFLFFLAIISMAASLVTNLAALPTKITIPVFFLSIIIDIAIIIDCAIMGMHITNTYVY